MTVELFSDRPFIEKLFCRFKILISHFLITLPFPEIFPKISRKFLRNFSENSYIPHLPTLPTHHPIHTHQSPAYLNPPRTLNSIFFTMCFFSNLPSFSHTVHVMLHIIEIGLKSKHSEYVSELQIL